MRASPFRCLAVVVALAPVTLAAQASSRAASAPILRIGGAEGEEQTLFNRISGVVRLSSGDVAIANQGSNEIRWFSAAGTYLRTTGRNGAGPGEYRGLGRLLLLPGDSVLAEDMLTARMTLYDGKGKLVRSWTIAPAGAYVTPPPLGRLADGSFVATTSRGLTPPPGHTRFATVLIRYRDGAIADTLATAPGGESFTVPCGTGVCNLGVPYGVRAMAAVAGGRIFLGNGERYELLRVDPRTKRVDTLRRNVAAVPLDAARRAYFLDSMMASLPPERVALIRDRLKETPVRPTMPFFDALIADDRGQLWLARPQRRGAAMRSWELLDGEGRLLRSVELPSGLGVMQVAGGHVVGVRHDQDGVESVEVYRVP
ncbi:MAG: hypothetical protein KA267_12180 [Gemmatimonadales bacterium]|nr:hypothetical protein [Gemmatimonadales bacterium]MBP6571672.1 hypothetical protein [Gemmatimonadales bacterium]MBP7621913.1 hypothetical protein [Gemmatimonadales bacterium]